MLYYILYSLHLKLSLFNVFRYITFRTVLSILSALIISFILTPFIIRKFREWKIKSGKREDVPERHEAKKETPTMGGFVILISTIIPTLLWADLVRAVVVDEQPFEVAGEEITHDPQRQLGLLVDERRRLRLLGLRLDRAPQPLEEVEVALDVLGRCALGGGADDHAPLLRRVLLEHRLQPSPLVVLEPAGDAEPLAVRDVHDEAAGQRDLGGEPRSLRLHRILHRLDEHVLAALDQILDLAGALATFKLRADDLVDVEEAVLLEADLDERRLHAGEDVVDDAEVDVAGDRPALRPLEVDLGDLVVLEHGDALLARIDGDEQLALGLRERRPLRRRAPARLRGRARLPLRLPRLGLRHGGGRRRLGSGRRRRTAARGRALLAVAPAAGPATALLGVGGARLSVGVRRFGGRLDGQRFNFGKLRGARRRRLILRLLASEKRQWQTISPVRSARAASHDTGARRC